MVNGTEVHSLLPWENATLYEGQVMTGEELFERFWEAPTLANLTSALILYFSKIRPSRLKVSWSVSSQRSWLGRLLVLGRRGKYKSEADYIRELLEKVDEFVSSGAVEAAVFPSGFPSVFREKKEELSAAVEGQEQKAPDVFLGYTARELCKEGAIEIAEDVTGAPIGLAEAAYSLAPAVYQAAHGRLLSTASCWRDKDKGFKIRKTSYRQKMCTKGGGVGTCCPTAAGKDAAGWEDDICKKNIDVDHRVEIQTLQFVLDRLVDRRIMEMPGPKDVTSISQCVNSRANLKPIDKNQNQDYGRKQSSLLCEARKQPDTELFPIPSLLDQSHEELLFKQLEGARDMLMNCEAIKQRSKGRDICPQPGDLCHTLLGHTVEFFDEQMQKICDPPSSQLCKEFSKLRGQIRQALAQVVDDAASMAARKAQAEAAEAAESAEQKALKEAGIDVAEKVEKEVAEKVVEEAAEKTEKVLLEKAAKETAEIATKKAATEALEKKEKKLLAKAMAEAEAKVAKKAGMAFAMSTVGEVLAPVFVATLATQCLLPSDTSPWARAAGEGAMVITYLAGRQAFKEGAKQLGKQLLKRVGGKAAGRLAGVGAAALAPEAAAVGIAVVVGIGASFAADYAIKAAEEAWVTDKEREEYECDCDWTSKWKCPEEVADLPLDLQQSVQIAKPKGDDLCFSYCCGIVNDMMVAAKDIIRERDALAEIVRVAEKNAIEEFKHEELISEALRRMHEQQQGHLREEPAARGSGSFRPGTAATFVLAISAVAAVFWMAARRRGAANSLV